VNHLVASTESLLRGFPLSQVKSPNAKGVTLSTPGVASGACRASEWTGAAGGGAGAAARLAEKAGAGAGAPCSEWRHRRSAADPPPAEPSAPASSWPIRAFRAAISSAMRSGQFKRWSAGVRGLRGPIVGSEQEVHPIGLRRSHVHAGRRLGDPFRMRATWYNPAPNLAMGERSVSAADGRWRLAFSACVVKP